MEYTTNDMRQTDTQTEKNLIKTYSISAGEMYWKLWHWYWHWVLLHTCGY